VPDWDSTNSSERDEDAAWRDLIARFDVPATTDEPVPWPEREDMSPPAETDGAHEANGADRTPVGKEPHDGWAAHGAEETAGDDARRGADEAIATGGEGHGPGGTADPAGTERHRPGGTADPAGTERHRPGGTAGSGGAWGSGGDGGSVEADRIWRALEAEGLLGQTEPDVIQATRRLNRSPGGWIPVRGATEDDDDDHFVPPAPPPLPKLDPLAKGAWAALFGGPGYLVVATALHWSVPGFAAFCAVAAFVTGFALLVLRMNESGPGGPDDGDDGAVV
jgi:hypothetical protein